MTEADWFTVVGQWAACWGFGFAAGHIQRWFQGIGEKL